MCLVRDDGGRRMDVVQERRIRRKPPLASEFLGVQPAFWRVEADVALSRDLPRHPVVRHFGSLAAMFTWPAANSGGPDAKPQVAGPLAGRGFISSRQLRCGARTLAAAAIRCAARSRLSSPTIGPRRIRPASGI